MSWGEKGKLRFLEKPSSVQDEITVRSGEDHSQDEIRDGGRDRGGVRQGVLVACTYCASINNNEEAEEEEEAEASPTVSSLRLMLREQKHCRYAILLSVSSHQLLEKEIKRSREFE